MLTEQRPSATDYFFPDPELQSGRTADETGDTSDLSSTDYESDTPDTDHRGMSGVSIQEEIIKVTREKYIQQYLQLSAWLGEFPTREEVIRKLEPDPLLGITRCCS